MNCTDNTNLQNFKSNNSKRSIFNLFCRYNNQLTVMRRDLRTCKSKIAEQQKQILEYTSRMDEYDKKNEETSRKFSTLLQELNKCKTELQYWRSKTPALLPLCNNCGQVGFIPTPTEELQTLNKEAPSDGNNKKNLFLWFSFFSPK